MPMADLPRYDLMQSMPLTYILLARSSDPHNFRPDLEPINHSHA